MAQDASVQTASQKHTVPGDVAGGDLGCLWRKAGAWEWGVGGPARQVGEATDKGLVCSGFVNGLG